MRILIVLISFFICFQSKAQVKEVNFLGKSWYLHGVDFRVQLKPLSFQDPTVELENGSSRLFESLEKKYDYTARVAPTNDDLTTATKFNIYSGLVFKPFTKSSISAFHSVEIAHNIGLQKEKQLYYFDHIPKSKVNISYQTQFINTTIFYQPQINISTRAIANRIKIYGGIDVRLATSYNTGFKIKNYAFDSIFMSTTRSSNSDADLKTSKREIGAGYTVGLKLAATCYFNFHVEMKDLFLNSWYMNTNNSYMQRHTGLNVGFRYKFAAPLSDEESEDNEKMNKGFVW